MPPWRGKGPLFGDGYFGTVAFFHDFIYPFLMVGGHFSK